MAAQHKTKRRAKKPEPRGESPVLRLKVRGPGIRSGRIAVPDLIKICQDAQSAVTRQAEALEGRKTLHPGPTTELIRHECTLELFAIRKGSTTLEFGLAKAQMALPFDDVKTFGAEVVEELADTIKSLGNGNRKQDLDPGVLQSIYGLGSVVGAGRISELTWIAPKGGRKQVRGLINKKVRERAATRLSGTFKVVQIDGVLDMADFSRRDRKCRIDPAIGASVTCTFGPDHETAIQALLRQPVRVVGIGKILPHSDRVESLDIQKIEPLPSLALGEGNFIMSPTIEQLAAAQGVKPLNDIGKLGGFLADDEVDEFARPGNRRQLNSGIEMRRSLRPHPLGPVFKLSPRVPPNTRSSPKFTPPQSPMPSRSPFQLSSFLSVSLREPKRIFLPPLAHPVTHLLF